MPRTQRFTRPLKRLIGGLVHATGAYRAAWGDHALVVFFHRIDDRYSRDPNTTSTRDFQSICEFLSRYFEVVPLAELVERLRRGDRIGRIASITFDDGYLDNAIVAAPILQALRLPATFFITTGFVDDHITPRWEAERGIVPEWMTWDHVRALHAQGFTIGAHTVTHPDLGTLDDEATTREITLSKHRIEQELGVPVRDFCYPFGWPQHISPAARRVVSSLGFRCAVETGDRVVSPGDDPERLGRIGISPWTGSGLELGVDALRAALRASRGNATARVSSGKDAVFG